MLHIKKDDTVFVLSGNDKGRKGRVLSIDPKKGRAIVEGINMVKKSTNPTAQHPQGGIIEKEAPIRLCKLAVVDPKTGKPTRVGFKVKDDGKKVRISKKSGEEIK